MTGTQRRREAIDDRLVRLICIPAFGIVIPHLSGLFGPHGPREAIYWLGLAWFIGLSALIWQSNRWLLFKQREHTGWFDHPVRKVVVLVSATVFGTLPVTVAMLAAWYRIAGFPAVDWAVIRTVALANVICVVFVTHVYETVFLIKEREADLVRVERLEKARALAELSALHAQIDPHFLFNALNTLSYLIETDPARARRFNDLLARVYRYILAQRDRHLVLLAEEMAFVDDYMGLLRLRFGEEALRVERDVEPDALDRHLVPPLSLQLLVENAVKHNELGEGAPLVVRMTLSNGTLVVENRRRPRPLDRPSAGVGLANLRERYRLATEREPSVEATEGRFTVSLPLLPI